MSITKAGNKHGAGFVPLSELENVYNNKIFCLNLYNDYFTKKTTEPSVFKSLSNSLLTSFERAKRKITILLNRVTLLTCESHPTAKNTVTLIQQTKAEINGMKIKNIEHLLMIKTQCGNSLSSIENSKIDSAIEELKNLNYADKLNFKLHPSKSNKVTISPKIELPPPSFAFPKIELNDVGNALKTGAEGLIIFGGAVWALGSGGSFAR